MSGPPIKSMRTLALEAGGSGELPELGEDAAAAQHLAAVRRFAELGGCRHREACGCANAQCLAFGGDATPARCVACIGSGLRPV